MVTSYRLGSDVGDHLALPRLVASLRHWSPLRPEWRRDNAVTSVTNVTSVTSVTMLLPVLYLALVRCHTSSYSHSFAGQKLPDLYWNSTNPM